MNDKLSKYTFDEIEIGLTKQFQITITESMVDDFAKLSGDFNPLHTDNEYAISSGFHGKVCHGMLLGSFFSRLIGMYLPGKHALHFSQSLKFVNPCIINEKVTVKGEVLDKSAASKIITIKSTITNTSKKIIVDGTAYVKVRDN
jgi:acyl dehydratase